MFLKLCNLFSPKLRGKIRFWLCDKFPRMTTEWKYGNPPVGGYTGGIDLKPLGVLAFRREDGSMHYDW